MSCVFSIKIDRSRRSGLTLVELLVGFTLTVLLLGLLFQFLIPALKISRRTTLRAEMQQRATLAMREMVSELEQTTVFGTSISPDSHTVAVHPIVEVSQNGRRIYADHLIVYAFDPQRQEIVRGLWRNGADPGTESPRRLSAAELDGIDGQLSQDRVMVDDVEEFELTHSGDTSYLQLPLLCRLVLKESEESGSRQFELIRSISPRNQQ